MATEVGDAYIDVHGDLTPFRRSLSKLNAAAKKSGREAADSFAEGYKKRVQSQLVGQWDSILDAFTSGKKLDWDKVLGKFESDSLDDAAKQIKKVVKGMEDAKKIGGQAGGSYEKLAAAVDNYVAAAKKQEMIDKAHIEALKDIADATEAAKQENKRFNKSFEGMTGTKVLSNMEKGFREVADAMADMDFSRIAKRFGDFDQLNDYIRETTDLMKKQGLINEENARSVTDAVQTYIKGERERAAAIERTAGMTKYAKLEADAWKKSFAGMQDAMDLEKKEKLFRGINQAISDMDWSNFRKGFKTFEQMDNAVVETLQHMREMTRVSDNDSKKILKSLDDYITAEESRAKAIRKTTVELEQQKQKADIAAKSFAGIRKAAKMQELTKDIRELAGAMETMDFSKVVRGFKSWEDAKSHIEGVRDAMYEVGQISDTELDEINTALGEVSRNTKKFGVELDKTSRKFRPIHFAMKKLQKSWDRMDSTVRLVLGLIAAGAGPMATLASGVAGAATALASSLAMAVGSAIPLASALSGVGVAIALAVKSMDSMKESFPGIEAGAKRLGEVWTAQAERFGQEWGAAVASLLNRLQQQLGRFDFGTPMGKAMSEITNAIEEVVGGPAFTALLRHMRQTLPAAVQDLGTGFANLMNGLVSMLAAAAPVARTLANDFERWAGGINKAIESSRKSGELTKIFERMRESLLAVLDFAGSLGAALGTLFSIGSTAGNQMLGSLTRIVDKFNAWMQTDAGRQTMLTWFQRAREIMAAIAPVAVGLAKALGGLVTERSIAQFQNLMGTIGELLPLLGNVLSTVSELGILNILAEAFRTVMSAVQPLLPALGQLASTVGPMIQGAIRALAPLFREVAAAIAPFIAGLARLWKEVAPVLVPAIQKIVAALRPIIAVIGKVVGAIMNVLVPVLGPLITGVINNVVGLIQGISDVVMGVVGLVTNLFQGKWRAAWESLKQIVSGAVKAVWNFVQLWLVGKLVAIVKLGLTKIVGFFTRNWSKIASTVSKWLGNIANFIRTGMNKASGLVKSILGKIRGFFSSIWNKITSSVGKAVSNVRSKIQSGMNKARSVVDKVLNKVRSIFSNIWNKITSVVQKAVSGVRSKIQAGMNKAKAIVDRILGLMKRVYGNIWNNIVSTVRSKINGVKNTIQNGMNRARSIVTNILNRIKGFFRSAWNGAVSIVRSAFGRLTSAVSGGINKALGFVRSLPGKIRGFLSGLGGMLFGAGKSIIQGFLNGLKSMWNSVTDFVGGIASWIKNNKGPISYDRVLLVEAGQAIMGGLKNGLESRMGDLRKTLGTVTESIAQGIDSKSRSLRSATDKMADAVTGSFSHSRMYVAGKDAAKGLADGLKARGPIGLGKLDTPDLARISQIGTVRHPTVASNEERGTSRGSGGTVIESGAIQLVTKSKDPRQSAGILLDELAGHTKMG